MLLVFAVLKSIYMGRPASIIVVDAVYRKLAETFYRHQQKLGYVLQSCQARCNYLREFLHWLECKGIRDITSVTAPEISRYYEYISTRPGKNKGGALSLKTTYSHMQILRDFFEMLLQQRQMQLNPTAVLQFPYPKDAAGRYALTPQEIQQLYQATETAQERAILSLAYGCGLRVSELVSCNTGDIRLREKILIIPGGKGNKRRVVPLSNGVVKDLANYYYSEREALTTGRDHGLHAGNAAAFMLHSRGGRMQKGTYNKILKQLIKRAFKASPAGRLEGITVHHLRHSIATHLLEQGMSLEQVRVFLGHSQLETTQIYTHINQHQLKKMIYDDT